MCLLPAQDSIAIRTQRAAHNFLTANAIEQAALPFRARDVASEGHAHVVEPVADAGEKFPPKPPRRSEWCLKEYMEYLNDIDRVADYVAEIEPDGKDIPVLLRQYLKYAERKGFKTTIEDETAGDTAGIKGATIKIEGEYAFGLLRTETGVHRLVRKSPFDSSGGRHTSFASVFVYPEVDDSIEIEINPSDVRTDTFRASGAGGQHINKTDSAVRLTHIPTGIVVQCQDGRSQHSNRDVAWKRLRSKLYDHELRKQQEEQQKLEDTKTDVGWGHQIRSYVLDNSRIKDLRTNVEVSATQKVLDGDLDVFIEASLKQGV